MERIGFFSILVLGLISSGFCQDVTNRQILDKLNSMDVRIARLETKVEEGQKGLQKQIDGIQNQINGLQNQINGLQNMILGVLAGIFALISFVLWDRRTALAPAVRKVEALEKREENLERVLKEFAMKEPRLTEALKATGLL
ncbi:MAG: hypothetical protein V2A53_09400 [bacterium]